MRVSVLASGSKGNATLIETQDKNILIDIGISYRKLKQKLEEINRDIDCIDEIYITHEHNDHVKGIQTFIKRHEINIYLSRGTYEGIISKKVGLTYEYFNILEVHETVLTGNTKVVPFMVSHDAREPFGYILYEGSKKLVYLTDTGFVSQANEEKIKCADVYILEANHNVEMLMCTNRPWHLKQRIVGDFGHLCNEDALHVLNRVKGENTRHVYLAHISDEANNYDILNMTIKELTDSNAQMINFMIAYQDQISETIEI